MRIRLVAPAGPVAPERIDQLVERLERDGHQVEPGQHVHQVYGHLAGNDAARLADLTQAMCDSDCDLVWALRGGFGCLRLLPLLDHEKLSACTRRPILLGYSDLTSLQNLLVTTHGWPCWHGPMGATEYYTDMDPLSTASLASLFDWIETGSGCLRAVYHRDRWELLGKDEVPDHAGRVLVSQQGYLLELFFPQGSVLSAGRGEAPLLGGNLSVLSSLCGVAGATPGESTLLLEDHGEYPFRLDRHLAQLVACGWLEKCRAVLLGSFLNCEEPDQDKSTFSLDELFADHLVQDGRPVLRCMPFGHSEPRICLPLGWKACVEADQA
jgi:muramoyltetrapeptide carboxypeptidase